jgi:hypothetical protein
MWSKGAARDAGTLVAACDRSCSDRNLSYIPVTTSRAAGQLHSPRSASTAWRNQLRGPSQQPQRLLPTQQSPATPAAHRSAAHPQHDTAVSVPLHTSVSPWHPACCTPSSKLLTPTPPLLQVDTMIVQAIGLLDDLDKELNTYAMRVREWYGWHFPEMTKIVTDNIAYAKTVRTWAAVPAVPSAVPVMVPAAGLHKQLTCTRHCRDSCMHSTPLSPSSASPASAVCCLHHVLL